MFALLGCTRAELAQAPVYGAWVAETIFTNGMGHVMVARKLPDGRITAGVLLVDAYCLGVKNAFLTAVSPIEFEELLVGKMAGLQLKPQTPEYAVALTEQAIEYARRLGFEPHPDYDDAALALLGIDPAGCAEKFVFGCEGKPMYIAGPHDSPKRIRQILAELTAHCGPDGFFYLLPGEEMTAGGEDSDEWHEEDDADADEEDGADEPPESARTP